MTDDPTTSLPAYTNPSNTSDKMTDTSSANTFSTISQDINFSLPSNESPEYKAKRLEFEIREMKKFYEKQIIDMNKKYLSPNISTIHKRPTSFSNFQPNPLQNTISSEPQPTPQKYTPIRPPNMIHTNYQSKKPEFLHQSNVSVQSRLSEHRQESYIENGARRTFLVRLKLLPTFNGESFKDLREFIDIANTLYASRTNDPEENEFYDQLILQLRGEARDAIKNIENLDWPVIREHLLHYFSHLTNKNVVSSQLENLHQNDNESISDYANRARQLLRQKNLAYNHLTEDQKIEHNRTARKAFTKGIKNQNLREKLLIRCASSLEDAIAYAIEAEYDNITQIPNNEIFCRFCKMIGHRENQCRRKNQNGGINQLISALRSLSSSTPNRMYPSQRNNQRPTQLLNPQPHNSNWNRNDNNPNNNYNKNPNRNQSPNQRPNLHNRFNQNAFHIQDTNEPNAFDNNTNNETTDSQYYNTYESEN